MGKLHLRRSLQCLMACAVLLLAGRRRSRNSIAAVTGTIKDAAGRRGARRDRHDHQPADPAGPHGGAPTGRASSPFRCLAAEPLHDHAELDGFKKATRENVQLDAAPVHHAGFRARSGRDDRRRHRDRRCARRCRPTSRIRKTVEAKDIEQLSLLGPQPDWRRRPEGRRHRRQLQQLRLREPQQRRLQHQRQPRRREPDHDRRRHRHAHPFGGRLIGIQNVDTVPGVQVLTASYMPEYGRAQRRPDPLRDQERQQPLPRQRVDFFRDETLDANTWARNRSPNAEREQQPGAVRLQSVRLRDRRPDPVKNKLFFFWAQEWIDFDQEDQHRDGADRCHAARRLQRAARAEHASSAAPVAISDPLTGQPFPGNVIPANRLTPNGLALLNMYPQPTPGFQRGTNNLINTSPNPQEQRKDTLRLDYRPNTATSSRSAARLQLEGGRRVPRRPSRSRAPTGTGPTHGAASWTSTLVQPDQRGDLHLLARPGVHRGLHGRRLFERSSDGHQLSVHLPGKEIEDKIPSITDQRLQRDRRRTLSGLLGGPIRTFSNTSTIAPRPPHVQGRRVVRVLGRGRLRPDQRQRHPRRHQQPERPLRVQRRPHRRHGLGVANVAMGLFTNYGEIGQRNFTNWRALAIDAFVQDSWKPTGQADRRRRRPLRLLAALVRDDQQHRDLRSARLRHGQRADRSTRHRPLSGATATTASSCRATASRTRATTRSSPTTRRPALFRGLPRGFSETHSNVFEPRLGIALPGQRQDGGPRQRRHLPQPRDAERLDAARRQPAVPAVGDGDQRRGRQPGRRGLTRRPAVRDDSAGPGLQAPDRLHLVAARPARAAPRLHDRRDLRRPPRAHLQRERNINQLPPGTLQANPGVNSRRCGRTRASA